MVFFYTTFFSSFNLMKQVALGLIIGVLSVLLYSKYTTSTSNESVTSINGSQIIQEQIKNVSKLIVNEGYFSDIITYSDVKNLYLDLLSAEKKAVVLVKAKAITSYNLKEIQFEVNEVDKIILVSNIPDPELQIIPKLTYYDLQQDYLNPFEPKDYNKISALVDNRLEIQIKTSTFINNSKNRLLSELHTLFSSTTLQGWTIVAKSTIYSNDLFFDKDSVPQ